MTHVALKLGVAGIVAMISVGSAAADEARRGDWRSRPSAGTHTTLPATRTAPAAHPVTTAQRGEAVAPRTVSSPSWLGGRDRHEPVGNAWSRGRDLRDPDRDHGRSGWHGGHGRSGWGEGWHGRHGHFGWGEGWRGWRRWGWW